MRTATIRSFSISKPIAGVLVSDLRDPFFFACSTAKLTTSCERGTTRPASGSHIAPIIESSSNSGNFSLASDAEIRLTLVPKALPDRLFV